MFALFEGLWYSFLILLEIVFWPVVIIVGITLLIKLAGKISRSCKKTKK